jgi:hypothetical protein
VETLPQALFVALGLVAVGLVLAFTSVNFWLVATPGGLRAGGVLRHRRAALAEFIRDGLPGVRYALIVGRREPQGRLRLVALGLSRSQRQRLRNFLLFAR